MWDSVSIGYELFRSIERGESGYTVYRDVDSAGRYIVGGVCPTVILPVDRVTVARCVDAVTMLLATAGAAGAEAVGCWVHEGRVYFDLSSTEHQVDAALHVAGLRGELAVFDRDEFVEIETGALVAG